VTQPDQPSDAWPVTRGEGVRVAVLDSGYGGWPGMPTPAAGRVLMFRDFTGSKSGVRDAVYHGTWVAECVRSIAPAAYLLVGKVINDHDVMDLSWPTAGVDWAVKNHCQVVNLSIRAGTHDLFNDLHKAIQRAVAAGVIVVCAAGNGGGPVQYPAAYDEVIAVGEVWDPKRDGNYVLTAASCRGPELDAVAVAAEGHTFTSFAAPVVSGAAVLYAGACLKAKRQPTPAEFRALLGATGLMAAGYPMPRYGPLVRAATSQK
jgi:hypothetical protein